MSEYTNEYLRENVRYGYKAQRGPAWWDTIGSTLSQGYAFDGPVPVEEARKLFGWTIREDRLECPCDCGKVDKILTREDTGHRLGIVGGGFQIHDYYEWGITGIGNILDDEVRIGSLGLLKYGSVAWVQVEMGDTVKTAIGDAFRPSILFYTSLDGWFASSYQEAVTRVVCDNTFNAALGERGRKRHTVKHTKNSKLVVADARAALGILQQTADAFSATQQRLVEVDVTNREWQSFIDSHFPIPEQRSLGFTKAGKPRQDTAHNNGIARHELLTELWTQDARVSPWRGTAWGAVMAADTYEQHHQIVRGASRAERNILSVIDGTRESGHTSILTTLGRVLDRDLVAA